MTTKTEVVVQNAPPTIDQKHVDMSLKISRTALRRKLEAEKEELTRQLENEAKKEQMAMQAESETTVENRLECPQHKQISICQIEWFEVCYRSTEYY